MLHSSSSCVWPSYLWTYSLGTTALSMTQGSWKAPVLTFRDCTHLRTIASWGTEGHEQMRQTSISVISDDDHHYIEIKYYIDIKLICKELKKKPSLNFPPLLLTPILPDAWTGNLFPEERWSFSICQWIKLWMSWMNEFNQLTLCYVCALQQYSKSPLKMSQL